MDSGLFEMLEAYAARGVRAMHMPGHKRHAGAARYLAALGAGLDITEIDGFDNLHDPSGILKHAMARAACLWGSQRAFFLVGGATVGILAGVRALTRPKDRVIVARNCHQSVYHALDLMALDAAYVLPAYDPALGILGSTSPGAVKESLAACPEAKLVIITSPTYEGAVSDVAAIARIAHARGVPLLVDEAHGAHLGFSGAFPGGAVRAGADVVIQSLHKTLPSLTQTAIAHVGGLADADRFQAQLGIFETSSPSYLLMASIDGCVRLIESEGEALFDRWAGALAAFDRAAEGLRHIRLPGHGAQTSPAMYAFDPGKIILSTRGAGLTGPCLMRRLREEHAIELEMAACDHALAMTSLTEPEDALPALARALYAIDDGCAPEKAPDPVEGPFLPERVLTIPEALSRDHEVLPPEAAVGRVSAQYAWAYPPGVPLIAPGERVDGRFLREARRCEQAGVSLRGGPVEGMFSVVRGF